MPAARNFGGAPGSHGGQWSHGAGFHGGQWSHGGGFQGQWSHGGGFHGGHGNHHFNHVQRGVLYWGNGYYGNSCYYGSCYSGYYGYPAYYAPPILSSGFDYPTYDTGYVAASGEGPAYSSYDDSALQVQIQHLTDEVEQMRQEQRERNQPVPQAAPVRPSRMDMPTVLVFRDGRVKEVQNYGIVGQTLWILDEQRARKVPLSELDLTATRNANDDRGGFELPVAR